MPVLPVGGIYNFGIRRNAPIEVMKKFKAAFIKAVHSKKFAAIAKRKFFEIDIKTGAVADRRAAQVEAITAQTFWAVRDQIGKKVLTAKELGLPAVKDFDKWWPPKGYKPIKGL